MHVCFPNGVLKALTMSYDDGVKQDRRLVEIFNKNGIKGTFHLNSGFFGSERSISAEEVKDLYEGHEVSVHSLNHPRLDIISDEELNYQISRDRENLEKLCGYIVRGMSYPFGSYNEEIFPKLKFLGMEYSRTVISTGNYNIPDNFLKWHPTLHHNGNIIKKLEEFKARNFWNALAVFYVWGHSYEFDDDNNWDMIEEFCTQAGNNKDFWYATNIEIFDYIQAGKNLKFSYDRTKVYNPSAIPVWIMDWKTPIVIESGETVSLK